MFKILIQWLVSFAIGLCFAILQHQFRNDYLSKYLLSNIISIQVSVIAINLATLGIIATKLADLIEKGYKISDFQRSLKQMRYSIIEQISLVAIAGLIGICSQFNCGNLLAITGNALIIGLMVQHLQILLDTGNSVFLILIQSSNLSERK